MSDQVETFVMNSVELESVIYNNALLETFIMNSDEFECLTA